MNQLEKSIIKILSDDKSLLSLLMPKLPAILDFRAVVPEFIASVGALKGLEGSCHRIGSHGRLPLPRISAGE